ncbi:rod shape-determining protein MreD [Thermomonospora echinospora]|uniref:Rod shape-determining protein MreD n=1 Tax=Thermomonospora echinospora TaxID=1992 RepID=A0A1H6BPY2_9ACTN|nr:rod shape-determining protein MreD [Thermomonospora echinospora]SEG62753.1 rod shape-determining protein MreD [Thermomonospora echinospora]
MLTTSDVSPTGRNLTAAAVLVVALILQVSVANRLPLPGAVTPDLVLLTVVALALTGGPLTGVVAGFCAGLAADIIPPADHTIGRYALVYCLVGYVCGLASDDMDRSSVVPFLAVAAGALGGAVLYAGLGMMLGDPRASWQIVSRIVPLQVVYDVLASPFVVWAVLRVTRRFDRERTRGRFDLPAARYRALSRM